MKIVLKRIANQISIINLNLDQAFKSLVKITPTLTMMHK